MEAILQVKNMKRLCALILVLLWAWSVVGNNPVPGDSVGLKKVDGKTLLIYKMSASETAYAVSRKFNITFKELEQANVGTDLGALKVGQEIFVPRNYLSALVQTKTKEVEEPEVVVAQSTNNSDSKKETIIKAEEKVNTIEPPKKVESEPEKIAVVEVAVDPQILADEDLAADAVIPNTDKSKSFAQVYAEYLSGSMIATSEKGVATWIDNNGIQSSGDRFYALHSSAPIGSIVKVRNLMNNRTIYAKVIGNLSESEKQEKVLIKLSAGAAERLNVLDNRFVVEMTYYVPDDKAMK